MQDIALLILTASSIWLVAVGVIMAWRPALCVHQLSLMASTQRINLTEQGFRFTAGTAMIIRGPLSKLPLLFEIGGWFIVATSILLMVLPLRWHAAYAIWWSRNLSQATVRALSFVAAALGTGLLYASL